MQLGLTPLLRQLQAKPELDYVLATVVNTQGSSYRKAGAMMLLPPDSEPLGLVSGGCLEGDLVERARAVRAGGSREVVHYDLTGQDDALWGLGLGCGGRIDVLLEPANARNGFAGLGEVAAFWSAQSPCWLIKSAAADGQRPVQVIGPDTALPAPFMVTSAHEVQRSDDLLAIPVVPPWRVLVCGAGVDAVPVVALCAALDWRVRVLDHRPAFARPERFDANAEVVLCDDRALPQQLVGADAVVIMAHNLTRDAAYLAAALQTSARYIGLLGPQHRRREVTQLAKVGDDPRVRGPAGLDIGATLPETIALAIVAEVQAVLAGHAGGSLS